MAKSAPSTLKACKPPRAVSSFARTAPNPSPRASAGSDTSGVRARSGWASKKREAASKSPAEKTAEVWPGSGEQARSEINQEVTRWRDLPQL